jgi:hypothetical protein
VQLSPAVRYGIPAALLALLYGLFLAYRPAAEALLSPAPTRLVPLVMLIALVFSIGCGWLMLEHVPSRLLRRLGMVGILVAVFYWSGNLGRGYYAANAFPADQLVSDTSEWMITMGSGTKISAIRRDSGTRTPRSFQADADALALARPGTCFERRVDRSPAGAERLAAGDPLHAGDLHPCT